MADSQPLLTSGTVAELERRMHWRALPAIAFMGIIGMLGSVAVMSQVSRPAPVTGVPDDADFRGAAQMVSGLLPQDGRWRLESALTGDGAIGSHAEPEVAAIARAAEARLRVAATRRPWDPRVWSAVGAANLLQGEWLDAERAYREALDRNSHHAEARLGLGVALAQRAEHGAAPLRPRALELAAIAQLTAVPDDDPLAMSALWNRAMLLRRVGRTAEAEAAAKAYLLRDADSRWSRRLVLELGTALAPVAAR